jgi:serine/threonine protein kinase
VAGRDGTSDGEDELPETSEQTAQLPTSRSDSPSDSAEDSLRATAATSSTGNAEATSDQLGATEPHNLTGSWQPPPPAHIALPGVVLDGRYRLEQMLGRGATAEVFRGTDDLLKRSVAIKVFHQGISDTTSAARQRTEMQVLAKLHHPHLVMVYDAKIGATTNDPTTPVTGPEALSYLVMELVQGGTLADRIKPGGLPPAEVAGIGAAVAGALAAVHRLGLVHRDIKPANILMSTTGEAKLSDFGIARDLEAEHLTAAADVIGTAAYLSPEQARGADVGPPTDIYALGLVLLECLTGRREFPGKAVESAMARLLRDPVIPADLPMPWPPLLRAMTQSDPRLRPTASAVEAALRAPAGTVVLPPGPTATATLPNAYPVPPAAAAGSPPAPDKPRSSTGRVFLIALLTTALVAFAVVAVIALVRPDTTGDPTIPAVTTSSRPTTSSSVPPRTVTTTATPTTTRTTPTTTSSSTPTTSSVPTTPSTSTTPTTTTPTTPTTPSTSAATAPTSAGDTGTNTGAAAAGNGNGNNGNGNGNNGNGNGNGNGGAAGG